MSIYQNGNCPPVQAPVCNDCPDLTLGGVRSIFLNRIDHKFADLTDAAEWDLAIANGLVYVFYQANGSVDQAESLQPGYRNNAQQLVAYEYTLNAHVPGFITDMNFWNSIKRSTIWQIGYVLQGVNPSDTLINLSATQAMIFAKVPVASDLKSLVDINVIAKWVQSDGIVPQAGPIGIFEECTIL
jgi:hypothetical protein